MAEKKVKTKDKKNDVINVQDKTEENTVKTSIKKIKIKKPKDKEDVVAKVSQKKQEKKDVKPLDFAVIRTGGKQYIVRVGEKHKFEKIEVEAGETIKIDDVLLLKKGDKVEVGTPKVSGAIVEAKVLSQIKDEKIIVFKYKKRKNYRRKQGHRQRLTEVEIVKI